MLQLLQEKRRFLACAAIMYAKMSDRHMRKHAALPPEHVEVNIEETVET